MTDHKPLTAAELEAIRERVEKATPGPWEEIWKPVLGFENAYEVSDYGQIRSHFKPGNHAYKKSAQPRIMKQSTSGGRCRVALKIGKGKYKTHTVARLVLLAFAGSPPAGHECAHLNGDAIDNRLSNLAWVTHKENEWHKRGHGTAPVGERNPQSKLVGWKVAEIRYLLGRSIHQAKLAALFDVSRDVVSEIEAGTRWAHVASREDIPALLREVERLRFGDICACNWFISREIRGRWIHQNGEYCDLDKCDAPDPSRNPGKPKPP